LAREAAGDLAEGIADLHVHTVASDGTQTVAELVSAAARVGLRVVAVTDHEAISDELRATSQRINGVEVVAGVELKADFDGVLGEILGLFVDPASPKLKRLLATWREARRERMAAMVRKCRERLNISIEPQALQRSGDGSVGRPHLARLLVERGVVSSEREAFDRYIGNDGPCYVPLPRPPYRLVVSALHRAGGIASLAHPCFMTPPDWARFLSELAESGVDAIEGYYSYVNLEAGRADEERLRRLARERGMLLSGGSDHHGPGSSRDVLGSVRLAARDVDALRGACRRTEKPQ